MKRETEYTASVALSQAREIPNWQKPAPKRNSKAQKNKRGLSFRALFKSGRVE